MTRRAGTTRPRIWALNKTHLALVDLPPFYRSLDLGLALNPIVVKAWQGVVEEEEEQVEEELRLHMRVVQIVTRMVIRMGHQALIQNSMETDTSLIGMV